MATLPVIQGKGLQPADNQLSAVPNGAYAEALNCIMRFRDVLEPRRGQKFLGQSAASAAARTFGTSSDRSNAGVFFEDGLLVHYGSTKLARDTGSAFSDYSGSFTPPDAALLRMKLLEAVKSLWFPCSDGVRVLEEASGTPRHAGVPKPTSLRSVNFSRSATAIHEARTNAAYRAVWARKDAHGRTQVSAVSQRIVVRNDSLKIAVGDLSRSGSTVTAQFTGGSAPSPGETVTLEASGTPDANFPEGTKTVTGVTTSTFSYTEAGSAASSNVAYEALKLPKENLVEIGIPDGVDSEHFYQLFRSLFTDAESIEPDDELYQVAEGAIPAAETCTAGNMSRSGSTVTATITAHGFLTGQRLTLSPGEANFPAGEYTVTSTPTADTFTFFSTGSAVSSSVDATFTPARNVVIADRQPEELAGGPLYTNPNTGDGSGSANERPPLAKDLCEWQERVWYANTTDRHRFQLQLLGVGSPDGVQSGDTITIGGRTYTASSSGSVSSSAFILTSSSTPSRNVEATAQSLCAAINLDDSANVYAFYLSAETDTPGKLLLEEREIGGAAFSIYASRPASWTPVLTTSSSGAQESKNDRRQNGLSYSKRRQPESVPLLNYLEVGPDRELLRVIPLRDKLFVFPEEGGIYTVSGEFPFRVDQLDGTAWLLAPDSAVVHANQIFALTNQGVCAISDAGVRVLSKGIEETLLELMVTAPDAVKRYAFGVSSETERQYQLWLPSSADDTCCSQAYVYNSLLGVWTKWEGSRTWGLVKPSADALYLGDGESNAVRLERKTGTREDFADEAVAVTVSSSSGASVVLSDASDVEAGDVLWQSDEVNGVVLLVNGNTVTLAAEEDFSAGGAQLLKGYTCRVRYTPLVPGGPSILKKWRDCVFHFRKLVGRLLAALFDTEKVPAEGSVAFPVGQHEGWGMEEWGDFPWGQETAPLNVRVGVSREHTEGTQLRVGLEVREAWAQWQLNGFSVEHEGGSERSSR